ncbi:SDR family oxidoreductase [Microbacterium arabinogalactanolyticum]|uniref:SDR family oxidoreductase n=1 Tax=Microbacterium arabinogalactanolyticum TaxID=69365 RepID=UPI002554779D|nr:SDR family oxidoreductase [Microbacterium arabinogalactanolyticum]GLC85118.1 3-ketoacyl-ACP reductase [Microbacterium arabinogalactanolyticum]
MHRPLPLSGQTALVTGVSRRKGIGFAVARELAALGAHVFIHHFRPHDTAQPWGGDDLDDVRGGIRDALAPGAVMADQHADLRDAQEIENLLDAATALTGAVDILVCNQALSGSDGSILEMTADRLDAHWRTNARASLLLTAGFARRKRDAGASAPFDAPTGRVIWMTSGQGDGPMRDEVAYATSKAGLAGVTRTVAAELLDLGIVLNTLNPGPVNTGYLDPETTDRDLSWLPGFLESTPFGRFGRPEDPARLIGWLCSDAGSWVVGQVLSSDGGFALR